MTPEPDFAGQRSPSRVNSAGNGGDCVEVAHAAAAVLIRDSTKRPRKVFLSVGVDEWAAFLRMAGHG
nr:DUF397 domain-containing protein [Streptomyces naganishii]